MYPEDIEGYGVIRKGRKGFSDFICRYEPLIGSSGKSKKKTNPDKQTKGAFDIL
jgi:hypothetical protein